MTNGFIDIHCHILPGIDDGASDLEESLSMLRIAKEDGITGIVATPHIMDGVYNNKRETIEKKISELRISGIGFPLYIGADVRICRGLVNRIADKSLPLINDKNYILIELPAYVIPPIPELENIVSSLKMKRIIPVITHPERNMLILNNMHIMEKLMEYGAVFQVTAMSITGEFGKGIEKFTRKLFRKGLVHAVATDAHDSVKRPPVLSKAYKKTVKLFNEDIANKVFITNPRKIINGAAID